ncbi:hypothetical protein GCK32_004851, partial [Trichostrongylus colubriformis]
YNACGSPDVFAQPHPRLRPQSETDPTRLQSPKPASQPPKPASQPPRPVSWPPESDVILDQLTKDMYNLEEMFKFKPV